MVQLVLAIFLLFPISVSAAGRCSKYLSSYKLGDIHFVGKPSSTEWEIKAMHAPTSRVLGTLEASVSEPGKVTIDIVYVNESARGIGVSEGLYRKLFSLIDPKAKINGSLSEENERAFVNHYRRISDPLSPDYRADLTTQERYREALNYTPEFRVKRAHGYTKVESLVVEGIDSKNPKTTVYIDVEVSKE